MRVVIEVIEGDGAGKKHWLASGQSLTFGRTQRSDVVFSNDAQMSSRHFELKAVGTVCQLVDLESTNGTSLNGEYIKSAVLAHGDEILVGSTKLLLSFVYNEGEVPTTELPSSVDTQCVSTTGGSESQELTPQGVDAGSPERKAVLDPTRAASRAKPSFTREPCMSGLTLFRGALFGEDENEPAGPSELAGILARILTPYWIVDFSKLDVPRPEGLHGKPLFDWLPPEVAAEHSPIIIHPDQGPVILDLLDDAWDCDGVCVFWSRGDADIAVVEHLVSAMHFNIRGQLPADGEPKAMLGYCWPSVLSQLLAFRTEEFVNNLLEGTGIVLLEMPDFPCTWELFAPPSFSEELTSLGFQEVAEAAPPA